MFDRQPDDAAPGLFGLQHGVAKIILEDEVGDGSFGFVSLDDSIEEASPYDAAAAPNGGDLAKAEIPAIVFRGCRHLLEALRIGDDLGGIERVADCVDVGLV